MADAPLPIDPELARARTLPAAFYREPRWFEAVRERVLARSWQWLGERELVRADGQALPLAFSPGLIDEPLLLLRGDDGELRLLSNVCTHRGHLVCEHPGVLKGLRCRYHGRRFRLDGRFESMPEFEGVAGFPAPSDDLPRAQLAALDRFLFGALAPNVPFAELAAPVLARTGFLPFAQFLPDPKRTREYLVRCHFALYLDNYLEGFHIPCIHPALARTLDYDQYAVELFPRGSLQLGIAREGEPCFELPPGHPDAGRRVGAWYFWLHPNTLLNFYPWGLSVNVVQPLAPDLTRVLYFGYVWKPELERLGAGGDLDRVEREDEEAVEVVQRGVRSRLYAAGRYSVAREAGVHHFHRLLAEDLAHA